MAHGHLLEWPFRINLLFYPYNITINLMMSIILVSNIKLLIRYKSSIRQIFNIIKTLYNQTWVGWVE